MSAHPVAMLPTIETDVYSGAQAHERPQELSACPSRYICPWTPQFFASDFQLGLSRSALRRFQSIDDAVFQLPPLLCRSRKMDQALHRPHLMTRRLYALG